MKRMTESSLEIRGSEDFWIEVDGGMWEKVIHICVLATLKYLKITIEMIKMVKMTSILSFFSFLSFCWHPPLLFGM